MKNIALKLAVMALVAATGFSASAANLYDNLGSTQDGADPILSYGPLANSFTTGADGGLLSSIAALLKNDSASIVGDLRVSLHADGAGSTPGAELLSVGLLSSSGIATDAFAAYSFALSTPFALAANTTYWVEIEAASPNAVEWAWSGDLSAPGVAGQSNYSVLFGANPNSAQSPYQMAVNVSAVPEPASMGLLLAGLVMVGMSIRRRS
ncbi:choice-of-anchor R domain-containing protein [Pelomonas sp. KK5]|uniref:choice-of-anchor R domain-containing protein n=1 Tax=Pelomonas sp. KK5 TaxID=1855730 RepID=UPI0009F91C41|nr:choice-of-anchor R domain-containing protein [Pelomonas sp. KK5]